MVVYERLKTKENLEFLAIKSGCDRIQEVVAYKGFQIVFSNVLYFGRVVAEGK